MMLPGSHAPRGNEKNIRRDTLRYCALRGLKNELAKAGDYINDLAEQLNLIEYNPNAGDEE